MTKRSGLLLIMLWTAIFAVLLRVFYISYGALNTKVMATAGKRDGSIALYNSKGVIYDCNLNLLAGNQPTYYLIVNPREFDRQEISYLVDISDKTYNEINEKLKYEKPFVVTSQIMPRDINGITSVYGYSRYPQEKVAQHIVGYLDDDGIVGLSGVERAYNDFLSKYNSAVDFSYTTNAINGILSQPDIKNTKRTNDGVVLTIDRDLSYVAEKSLKEFTESGCVIVMDCNNGNLLTLSSTPGFEYKKIAQYENNELLNNALVNQTVGSVFKIVVALSAIENKIEEFEFECNGGITVSDRVFSCQNANSHGLQMLSDAFANSCNCYFIAIGQLLGYDKIMDTAKKLGLDSSIKISKDLYSYSAQMPEDESALSLANLSIGQGELLISPLSVARMTATVCNGGFLVNPTIYKGMYLDGELVNCPGYSYKSNVIDKSSSEKIKQMCIECVNDGTGKNAKPNSRGAGGKTASAQTGKYDKEQKEILNTYFTGFYPADTPQYVITVFAHDGKSGAETCAPVFKEICNYIEQNC